MAQFHLLSASEQVAAYLRMNLARGKWIEKVPGVNRLAVELGVNRKTVASALRQLEREGAIAGQGHGKKRLILQSGKRMVQRPLRLAILEFEPLGKTETYMVELVHFLQEAGHTAFFTDKSLRELEMKVSRVRRLVAMTKADAWVVTAGSREVLQWFASQPIPTFAAFGRREGLPIASIGPDKAPAYRAVAERLARLGHRRIVLLTRRSRRLPEPGRPERAFIDGLAAKGIPFSSYNFPNWKENVEGLHRCLESLFHVTPPTAIVADDSEFFCAIQQFLLARRIGVPEDVSLVACDYDKRFDWCRPSIAHIAADFRPVVRRIVRWAANISGGKRDIRQSLTPCKFVPGGTIGPAPSAATLDTR